MKLIRPLLCAVAIFLNSVAPGNAQTLDWRVVSSAGSVATGPGGSLSATIGQPVQHYLSAGSGRLTQGFRQPELDLRMSPVIGPFCNGDTLMLSFSKLGYFGPSGSIVAELSDALGDFSSPQVIGSAVSASGTVFSAIIPFTISPGSGYKIRLRTAAPLRTSNSSTAQVVNLCSVRLNINALLEGLYIGSGSMVPALFNAGISSDSTASDSIQIQLHQSVHPFDMIQSVSTVLHSDGNASCVFPSSIFGGSYYIVLRHRNTLETWSKNTLLFDEAIRNYDFIH